MFLVLPKKCENLTIIDLSYSHTTEQNRVSSMGVQILQSSIVPTAPFCPLSDVLPLLKFPGKPLEALELRD